MAIYQRGKSFYYDFVYKGQRYTGCIGPVSRTVAKEEEARKKAEVIEGRLNPAKARKTPRFDAFAEEYLEWLRTNRKPQSVLRAQFTLKNLIPFFGQKKLSEITPWLGEQYKRARKSAGVAPATVNVELILLRATLRKAREWQKLREVPPVKLFPQGPGKTRFLSEGEEATLLAAASPALRQLIQAGLLTGFRRQELASLRPEDVDLDRGTVSVAACYSKNGESRTLQMGPRLRGIIEEALATRGDAPTVFVTGKGIPWSPGGLTQTFRQACRQAGIQPLGPPTSCGILLPADWS